MASNLIISNCGLGANGSFSLVDSSDNLTDRGTLITYQSSPSDSLQNSLSAQMTHSYLPLVISESENSFSQETVQSATHAFEPWPEEEERKYEEMLRLLYDGSNNAGSGETPVTEGQVLL